MSDLISRQAAIDAVAKWMREDAEGEYDKETVKNWNFEGHAKDLLESVPSADRPIGKWEEIGIFEIDGVTIHVLRCKKCGALHRTRQYEDRKYANAEYCPHCGVKMEVENV